MKMTAGLKSMAMSMAARLLCIVLYILAFGSISMAAVFFTVFVVAALSLRKMRLGIYPVSAGKNIEGLRNDPDHLS